MWVTLSVTAAFLQNLRSSAQKRLSSRLSTRAAAATRFQYGLPVAALWLMVVLNWHGGELPELTLRFAIFVIAGSLSQITGTVLLLMSFTYRSFAVGSTYSKTEGIQAVLIGFAVLGDRVSVQGLAGVLLTVVGVLSVTASRSGVGIDAPGSARTRGAVIGLLSGTLFAAASVCYRGASLALDVDSFVLSASLTLFIALALQCTVMTLYLRLAEPGQLTLIGHHWRLGLIAGVTGAFASAGWFMAVTLVNAAYVKAVGSIELIFSALTSWLLFREKPAPAETAGVLLVMAGIVVTVMSL